MRGLIVDLPAVGFERSAQPAHALGVFGGGEAIEALLVDRMHGPGFAGDQYALGHVDPSSVRGRDRMALDQLDRQPRQLRRRCVVQQREQRLEAVAGRARRPAGGRRSAAGRAARPNGMSSKPISDMSSGTLSPRWRRPPAARRWRDSREEAKIAVGGGGVRQQLAASRRARHLPRKAAACMQLGPRLAMPVFAHGPREAGKALAHAQQSFRAAE